ncbi:RagB/SusD family nutrient uptake outer membrane protein [Aquimarina sp. ERC-38]|uniref:RagB/SusD family nutrient uptake outer membrane protein n=1 Tax=Aquimarina sp. ERC-38 TaxID=2949996 RepID=UPI002247F549|nr:RagB/SusD family nutrient uptake outer membrane protein [Aquimarina sp. ERC-38]UZO82597.1 RagB/SusD family nutrient uptake outer membrane protein [Aquimarina sp. ERC-38]
MKIKKRLHVHITFLLSILVLTSCDLDVENINSVDNGTFWRTENDFERALNTVYGALQFQSISGSGLAFEMLLGDEAGTESFYRQIVFSNLTFGDATEQVVDKWNELYIGIFRANQVLAQIPLNPEAFDNAENAVSIEAQARFFRAFYYFQLIHTYGQAVIRTEVPETSDQISAPLSNIEEVTNQIIIPDLQFAKENLPRTWPESDLGRVTWGAATSLLGKSYLYTQQWSQAATQLKEVIDSNIYRLAPNNLDNFSHLTEFNSESILETPYNIDINPGVRGEIVDNNNNETGAEASAIARSIAQLNFAGFNVVLPTYYLHELFVRDSVDVDNPVNDDNMQSKRMGASIVPIDGDGLYYGLPIGERPGWVFGQSSYAKKYSNWYHLESEDGLFRSEINYRHIRLADVYLMYAEAVLEANGDVDTAIEFIDLVRRRAGVITLRDYIDTNGTFPAFHISKQVNGGVETQVTPSVESVRTHLRRVERPLELCLEGHRWKDLVRWGIAGDVISELNADEEWRLKNQDGILDVNAIDGQMGSGAGVAPLFIRGKIRQDFAQASKNYSPELHNYLPIPAAELQTNDEVGN